MTYSTYLYRTYQQTIRASEELDVPADVSDRYDDVSVAATWDADMNLTEWLMGIDRLRRRMTRLARGDVLEVAVGTGRNSRFYRLDMCRRLVFVDRSRPMLDIARLSFESRFSSFHSFIRIYIFPFSLLQFLPSTFFFFFFFFFFQNQRRESACACEREGELIYSSSESSSLRTNGKIRTSSEL